MALFDIKLFSTSLLTNTDIRVVIPTPDEPFLPDSTPYYQKDKRYQVLYLLHGAFGDATVWTRNSGIERFAQKYKLAVVCASVTNSCYVDMAHGAKFLTYMTKELPAFINAMFPVSIRREDTFIAGMSMGGYGSYRVALETPQRFACAASLSGAVDIAALYNETVDGAPSAMNIRDVFGDKPVEGTDNDIFALIRKRQKEGVQLPRFYQCCGTEDFLYSLNCSARERLEELKVDLTYDESPGIHNWDYWDEQIKKVLQWLPLKGTLVQE
ncbi:MAG: alpha/beta hydrolase [Hungatella hathewayi]